MQGCCKVLFAAYGGRGGRVGAPPQTPGEGQLPLPIPLHFPSLQQSWIFKCRVAAAKYHRLRRNMRLRFLPPPILQPLLRLEGRKRDRGKRTSCVPKLRRDLLSNRNNRLVRRFLLKRVERVFLNFEAIGLPP
jgi:hypothetical protein